MNREAWPFAALLWGMVALPCALHAADTGANAPAQSCPAAKEFITTLEFIRDRKEMKLPDPEARKLAEKVASGCEGSARRFIRVALLLSQSGFTGKDSAATALELARRSDSETETFITVFRTAFLSEHLDLDLGDSLQMAKSLSSSFPGEAKFALKDFQQLVDFCANDGKLGLPKPLCGDFAQRVARLGRSWDHALAPEFLRGFQFTVSDSGPHLTTGDSLKICEELVASRPGAIDNFIQAYQYGVSKKGLGLASQDALSFARELAKEGPRSELDAQK